MSGREGGDEVEKRAKREKKKKKKKKTFSQRKK